MIPTTNTVRTLNKVIKFNKIEFTTGNPYNLRWQWKWKHAYYTYPRDSQDPTFVKKPQDMPESNQIWATYFQDLSFRFLPISRMYWARRRRIMDSFQLYFLPGMSFFFSHFWDAAFGFKMMTILPIALFYTRMRDRCQDPDIKETFLRDMVHQNPELGELFKPETIHVLDYELEFDEGYPDPAKFPQFENKFWRFFNSDAMFCTGSFKFGDLESGATMNLKVKCIINLV